MDVAFLLKKSVSLVATPTGLVLLALLCALYLWRRGASRGKYYVGLALFIQLFFAYDPVAGALARPLERLYPALQTAPASVRYVMVLGSGHHVDATIPITSRLVPVGVVRLSEGVRLYRQAPGRHLVVSGWEGFQDKTPHALMAAQWLREMGVAETDIVTLSTPKDTFEEAAALKQRIGDAPFVLVTSASHMPRAMQIFTAAGLHPIPAPTFHRAYESHWISMPRGINLYISEMALHEYLGLLWYQLRH